jgi:type IX secretion system PorP/SprF family membrane protein
MRKSLITLFALLPVLAIGQQFPFMEAYNVNPFNLSPAFAGIHNGNTLFLDYRSDWTGIDGGPTTYQLSYSQKFENKVGVGGRFIYDKTDIFKQMLLLGTYTYGVNIAKVHTITFGLSIGFYKNSIDFGKYFNDPDYVSDLALVNSLENSKIKFATDFSILYSFKELEAGILFSNIMFGTARYSNTDLTYKPLKNYLVHSSYLFDIASDWSIKPSVIFRGGQNVPVQLEIAPTITWNKRFWGTPFFRTGGILGMGLGGEVFKGVLLNYTYSLSTNVSLNTFTSHHISLGIRLFNPRQKGSEIKIKSMSKSPN